MRYKSPKRRGTIAVLVAVSLAAILGVVAIALDGGLLLDNHRQVQAAADAAALAASDDLFNHYGANNGLDPSGTAQASALSTAAANGYNNDGTTSIVTVNIPPKSGSYAGKAGYAEVIVQFNQKRYFSSIFGSGDLPVTARAVARGVPGNIGILVLDPTLSDACEIDGSVIVQNGGQIFVNSSDSSGTQVASVANITVNGINVIGGLDNKGGTITYTGSGLQKYTTPIIDPLKDIPEPTDPNITVPSGKGSVGFSGSTLYNGYNPTVSTTGMTKYGSVTITKDTTLQPGIYTGITIGTKGTTSFPSDPSVSTPGPTVTLAPGLYYLEPGGKPGGISLLSGTLQGTGVMFVVATGNDDFFNNNCFGIVNITPPTPTSGGLWPTGTTSATYNGISVWIPRGDFSEYHVVSGYNLNMPGTWYAQGGEFDVRPSGSATFNIGNWICDQAEWCQGYGGKSGTSSGTFIMNPNTAAPNLRPALVE